MLSRSLALGLVCALVGTAGCADPEERSTTWSYLHATIIEPSCATSNCHSAAVEQGGLDLSEPDTAYTALTSAACGGDPFASGLSRVRRNATGQSPLEMILHGTAPGVDQMPLDAPLAPGELRLISTWIDEGAQCQ